ncbi:MAG: Hsp20/alpha crystallin family protein [Gemmatales bacterium]|nr:Hsp20/alpha crystallin family protein [Gemmatales bacterium]MCS7161146.1 Hsp20/alpha crystallin family protein [Gemmatales bacterium]MDW8176349.1 Hsp20/alpha crystallin family protein [Gemmatales bacterium]MDW8221707.1 Hsp20/alpha crystallin family protein [Gemmatales bacterium]
MARLGWEPLAGLWREMENFRREMDRLLERWGWEGYGWPSLTAGYPPINVWEDEANVYAELELPGMALEDLEIYVTGRNQLSIKGERKAPQVEKGTWLRQERPFGSFHRIVTLPVDVEADKVEARLQNGVLTIVMPKCEEAKPRKITVKAV